MSLTSAFTAATSSSASTVCSQPVQEVLDANDQNGIVDVRVPVGLEARGEHESPTVIEDHQPRVPQTRLLYVLRVGVAQHLPEAATSRARLLLVTRLDGKVRAHLRDEAVAVALARLFGNLARRPTSFLLVLIISLSPFVQDWFDLILNSFLNKGQLCYLFTKGTVHYIVILLILFYRCRRTITTK